MIIQHILVGLAAIALGVASIHYNYQLVNMTGRQDWIESKLGSGSTYITYKFFGLVVVVFGLLYLTGLGTPLFQWLLTPLKGIFAPK